MTPDQIKQLEVAARRNRGPNGAHPDVYLRAGSVFTLGGVDFAIPPLYPSGATSVVPRFDEDSDVVSLDVRTDTAAVDASLVALGRKVHELAPVDEGQLCPECGQSLNARLLVDPVSSTEFLQALFGYARRCLLRMYDLGADQLAALLAFDSAALPAWVTQVLDHALGQPGRDI